MISTTLFYIHYTFLLLFGILLSFAFTGIKFTKKNIGIVSVLFVLCGVLQLSTYILYDETFVWQIYPLIAHLPTILLLCFYYRKRLPTSLAAVSSAYLCCQLPKWLGLLFEALTGNNTIGQIIRITTLLVVGFVVVCYLARYLSDIFNKDNRSVFIFGMIPMVYYVFDYSMGI